MKIVQKFSNRSDTLEKVVPNSLVFANFENIIVMLSRFLL